MRNARLVAALAAAWMLSAAHALPQAGQEAKLKALIVTGFDVGSHKWRETTPFVRTLLEETGRFDVRVSEDIGIFESAGLAGYDVVILNYGFWEGPQLSEKGRAGLLEYVKGGKGLVPLHFACSAFQDWGEYASLLGRVWKKGTGGHGPRGKFTVKVEKPEHPIMKGLADFEADDELYAKLSGDAEIEVLASAHSDWSGKVEPIVFLRSYGKGLVVHNVLGHDMAARQTPAYKTLLSRGVEFAATGAVTVK